MDDLTELQFLLHKIDFRPGDYIKHKDWDEEKWKPELVLRVYFDYEVKEALCITQYSGLNMHYYVNNVKRYDRSK